MLVDRSRTAPYSYQGRYLAQKLRLCRGYYCLTSPLLYTSPRVSIIVYTQGLEYSGSLLSLLCIEFSVERYGEVININLLRHADTGKSRGFCFLCYQDQRSTVLAVDNLNGITCNFVGLLQLLKRQIRVDHVEQYKVPKYKENADEETKRLWEEGCAPKPIRRAEVEKLPKEPEEDMEEKVKEKVLSLKEDEELKELKRKIKEDKKRKKKEKREAKKEKKKLKKLLKSDEKNLEKDWKDQSKLFDKTVK
ncbi:unnamed protein product, partial [Cylicostephanus goldi]